MVHLVAYDISDPGRLRRVAKTCLDYGMRVELSVFECDLEEPVFEQFWKELLDLIDSEQDSLLAYRLCLGCVRETLSAGMVVRPGKMLVYLP
jgi:CRISPR-associated protein Cas2